MFRGRRRPILAGIIGALALAAGALFVLPAATPAADPGALSVAEECRQALGYDARTPEDLAWLQTCVHALTAPTVPPTSSAPPTSTPPPSPSPSPTASSPPSPTPTTPSSTPTASGPVVGCIAHPGVCGFPDASTAGAHGQLAPYAGPLTFATAGALVHDVAIAGCPVVTARGVVFRNVTISCGTPGYVLQTAGAADTGGTTTVDHVTVVCAPSMHGGTAFGDERMTAIGVDISHCENGFDANEYFIVVDSYIHDMFKGDAAASDPHTDGIQVWPATSTSGPIVFNHNTVLMVDDNATFTSGPPNDRTFGHGVQSQLTIDGNLLDGGSFTVYCSGNKGSLSNNRWGAIHPGTGYPAGYTSGCGTMAARTGNVSDVTGGAISASQLQ